MEIGLDLGSYFVKASRLSLEGFPMTIQDGYSKSNYSINCLERVDNGFLIGQDSSLSPVSDRFNLGFADTTHFTDQHDVVWHADTLLALILKKIKADIDTLAIDSVNFAIPVDLSEVQKKVINSAVKLAKINQCSLIEAPLAAIAHHRIHYLHKVLVLDWGYSGLKISIINKDNSSYQIFKHEEIMNIGGKAWTQKLVDEISKNFENRFGYTLPQLKNSSTKLAEELKLDLSICEYATQDVIIDTELVNITIARQAFEQSIKSDLGVGMEAIKKLIEASDYQLSQIEGIVLTGGCMNIPCVKQRLRETFTQTKKWFDNDPLTAIAMGASAYNNSKVLNIHTTESIINTGQFLQQHSLVKNTAVNGVS